MVLSLFNLPHLSKPFLSSSSSATCSRSLEEERTGEKGKRGTFDAGESVKEKEKEEEEEEEKREGRKKRKEKRSMMEILPASCSIFSTSVLCPKGGLFFPRPPFFILLSICSFILESLSAPSDPLFIVPVLRSYVKAPLFNLTSLIPFSFFLLPPSPSSPSSSSPCSSFFFSPPFSHNRLRKGTQPSGKRSATRRGISFFSFDSW